MKGEYNPDHPLEPSPPTFINRILCRIRTHYWTLSSFHHHDLIASYICLGCSKVMTVSLSTGRITEPPISPVISQH
jgi:hypothetical protein